MVRFVRSLPGRKALPLKEYLQTRKKKLDQLQKQVSNFKLTVKERNRYRAQAASLKKRMRDRILAYRRNGGSA